MFKLYLAHPITGLSGSEIFNYYDSAKNDLKDHYHVLSPVTGKDYLRNIDSALAHGYNNILSNDHAIFQRDTWMVSQSDIVFCDFTGSTIVSIGCCMELAIASFLNKHTVIVLPENDIHKHSFILEAADVIFNNYEDALKYLINLAN